MKIPNELINVVRGPILRTWNNIAPDAYELCEGDNKGAIELCIDADRLTFFVRGKELEEAKVANAAIEKACKEHGYTKVLKFLSKHIQLI